MASVAATNWHRPISLVAIMSGISASVIFTQGVLSGAIPWKLLQEQYFADSSFECEFVKLIQNSDVTQALMDAEMDIDEPITRVDAQQTNRFNGAAFRLGQSFARHYPSGMSSMDALQQTLFSGSSRSSDIPAAAAAPRDSQLQPDARLSATSSGAAAASSQREDAIVSGGQGKGAMSGGVGAMLGVEAGGEPATRGQPGGGLSGSQTAGKMTSGPVGGGTKSGGQAAASTSASGSKTTSAVRHHTTSSKDIESPLRSGDGFTREALSWLRLSRKENDVVGSDRGQQEALAFMRGVMDECTHLANFSRPVDTELVIIMAARSDAYIPCQSAESLRELWAGAEVRYIDSGHISAFLFKQADFRKAIVDSFDRQIEKYYSSETTVKGNR